MFALKNQTELKIFTFPLQSPNVLTFPRIVLSLGESSQKIYIYLVQFTGFSLETRACGIQEVKIMYKVYKYRHIMLTFWRRVSSNSQSSLSNSMKTDQKKSHSVSRCLFASLFVCLQSEPSAGPSTISGFAHIGRRIHVYSDLRM